MYIFTFYIYTVNRPLSNCKNSKRIRPNRIALYEWQKTRTAACTPLPCKDRPVRDNRTLALGLRFAFLMARPAHMLYIVIGVRARRLRARERDIYLINGQGVFANTSCGRLTHLSFAQNSSLHIFTNFVRAF